MTNHKHTLKYVPALSSVLCTGCDYQAHWKDIIYSLLETTQPRYVIKFRLKSHANLLVNGVCKKEELLLGDTSFTKNQCDALLVYLNADEDTFEYFSEEQVCHSES